MSQYIELISKIKQKNNLTFKLLDLSDAQIDWDGSNNKLLCANSDGDTVTSSGITWNQSTTTCEVGGDFSITGDLYIEGQAFISNIQTVTGSTVFSEDTQVIFSGSNYFAGDNYFNNLNYFSGSIYLTGSFHQQGDHRVSGSSQITGSLGASGSIDLYGPTNITGNTNIHGLTNIHHDLHISGNIFQYSDKRLKKNVENITNSLQIIKNIDGVKFDWIKDQKPDYGFIAQQIQQYIPQMVSQNKTTGYKQISYSKMIPFLLQAIKQLQERVESLEQNNKMKGLNKKNKSNCFKKMWKKLSLLL